MTHPISQDAIRVLVQREDVEGAQIFYAQALEVDVGAQGSTVEEALERLGLTLRLEKDFRADPANADVEAIPPAPQSYHDAWNAAPTMEGRPNIRAAA